MENTDDVKPPVVSLAVRNGFGTAGRPVELYVNYYEVKTILEKCVYQYDIEITQKPREPREGETAPPAPIREKKLPPRFARELFDAFVNQYGNSALAGIFIAYDGARCAYSVSRLPLDSKSQVFEISHSEGGGGRARTYLVKVMEAAEIDLRALWDLTKGKDVEPSVSSSSLRVLDTVLYQDISKTHFKVGRSFFTSADSRGLGQGIDLWRGVFQSIKAGMSKLYLNLDIANTTFLHAGPLIEFALSVLQMRDPGELQGRNNPEFWHPVNRLIKGTTMIMNHRGKGMSKFKAKSLASVGADQATFDMVDPKTNETRKISVADYMKEKYGVNLRFPFLPCVEFSRGNFLPMELCDLAPGIHHKKKLNEQQTAEMIRHACLKPHLRQEMIQRNFDDMRLSQSAAMNAFNFSINDRMVRLKARMLPTPEVFYSDRSREPSVRPNGGAWNMRDKVVWKGTELNVWGVAVFMDQRKANINAVQDFIRVLINTCKNTGMNINNTRPQIKYIPAMGNVSQPLHQFFKSIGDEARAFPQMILCILPSTSSVLYGKIKSAAYTELGVHTQCMVGKNIFKPNPQYCANLCLKMNVKMGGISAALKPTSLPIVSEAPTIILGADVTHPGIGELDRPSIAAVVGSMDSNFCKYKAMLAKQGPRIEIIQDLTNIVRDQLISFFQSTGFKPKKIIFYRDGVSEGQFAEVMAKEVQAITDACELLEKGYQPNITFIIVKKGHRTRFMPIGRNDADRSGNCMPGTVVDTDIVSPYLYDFYLQSHSGIQGTSRCVHYIVLKDENGFTPDSIQTLSYNMCYLYAICTRSVSLVPCVYYAHRVAFRSRSHTKETWSNSESGSVASGFQNEYVAPEIKPELLPVHDRLKQSMYFM
ncbi:Protein argonaute-3 [Smittium culicis]|uniref:Protein argonaute-3 n=1 Tax=Smittium culicis TaxID=133412 RepID=A0A1R1Y6G6_9FUNG|nr:Protein argonaute-3 [Smittium culicis]OMJ29172.1 Protein argonaute-3 [Smittium culicis]